ncbi:MAG: hypothetical protein LBJ76_00845 [Candidatus Accumulibacter sp.]|jgi:hypothetical protein|nr:hypothetical protein [Accumulibacter sp.]
MKYLIHWKAPNPPTRSAKAIKNYHKEVKALKKNVKRLTKFILKNGDAVQWSFGHPDFAEILEEMPVYSLSVVLSKMAHAEAVWFVDGAFDPFLYRLCVKYEIRTCGVPTNQSAKPIAL